MFGVNANAVPVSGETLLRVLVLAARCRGAYADNSTQLKDAFLSQLRSGDIVLVKGSFGSRMSVIIEALKTRAAAETV